MSKKYSQETIDKLVKAVRQVVNYPWGGHWPFVPACQEALEAVDRENPVLCERCQQPYNIFAYYGGRRIATCFDCLVYFNKKYIKKGQQYYVAQIDDTIN